MDEDRPAVRRPPGRYDEPRPLPRAARVTGYALLGALLVGVAWIAYDRFAADRVRAVTLGYDVQTDSRVVVRFEVHKPASATVRCRVQAQDRAGAVVGDDLVVVGPADDDRVRTSATLSTTGRAATGQVVGCVAGGSAPAPAPTPGPSSP